MCHVHVASLVETKTGVVHHVRNPSPRLWAIAVRKQKKRGLPDKARFTVWSRCGTRLRANSLSTSQSVTCIACLMQTQEEADAREAAYWRQAIPWPVYRVSARQAYAWTNQIMGQWVPYPKEEEPVATNKQGVLDLDRLGDVWRTADGIDHYACKHQKNWNQPTMARCGESLGGAINLTLMPMVKSIVTCIACLAGANR